VALDPAVFERRFLSQVLLELVADPRRGRSTPADQYVMLRDVALFRAVYLEGTTPDTVAVVLFSFADQPSDCWGFRSRVWEGLEMWDDGGPGKSIFNDPERAAGMFCVAFEEVLETRGPQQFRVAAALTDPIWIGPTP
jgi:hypothetical protein